MKIINPEDWTKYRDANVNDAYGVAILDYAERWADLMEKEIADGKELKDIAEATSHEADVDGITGFMYGMAVQVLALCWEHGEALRIWHNLDTQIGDEGERANKEGKVLNPAIITIGGK